MRVAVCLVFLVSGFAFAGPQDTAADEKAALAALNGPGIRATIDPDLPKDARVAVKFETAGDGTFAVLKKYRSIGSIHALDGTRCTATGFATLAELPNLRRLVLNSSGVSDKELEAIAKCKALRELIIPASATTDAGLVHLLKMPRLESLDISENPRITDAGMKQVAQLERLEHLYLGKTSITDKGLFELKPLEGLRNLHVAGTKVTDKGAEKFAEEMPNLRVVRR